MNTRKLISFVVVLAANVVPLLLATVVVTTTAFLTAHQPQPNGHRAVTCSRATTITQRSSLLAASYDPRNDTHVPSSSAIAVACMDDDVVALQREAAKLRAEAAEIRREMDDTKATKARQEVERIDQWIDDVLIAVKIDNTTQMLHTEEQVMRLMQQERFSADHVNKIFDRICELSPHKVQSNDNCSPLLSLLLDAACKLDCMERADNPNKRWNHRVERDLRKKLFAIGWGINLDDVQRKDRQIRSLTGEQDLS